MIIDRYVQRQIHLGTLAALLALVSLSLFFLFVRELEDLGTGNYGLAELFQYVALRAPERLVEFMPLAVLLGSLLGLGALAGNSELIAMQASGVSLGRLIGAVLRAGLLLALVTFFVADWVLPDSEAGARNLRNQARDASTALHSRQGLWVKDENRVVHFEQLLPNGIGRGVDVFQFDAGGRVVSLLHAESALPVDGGWELRDVRLTRTRADGADTETVERLRYPGRLSIELLDVLLIEPRQMSIRSLNAYLDFLDDNRLESQKALAPFTILVMCLLALPFVLGSARQGHAGQRLMFGILIGLGYVVSEQLLTQLGTQYALYPALVALAPNLLFLGLALFLLLRGRSVAA